MKKTKLISNKNFILFLAAVLVILTGYFALTITKNIRQKPKPDVFQQELQEIQTQSNLDDIETIEEDLNQTNLNDTDRELQEIENELNKVTF